MKTIGRILAIVAAMALVMGIVYVVVNTGGSSSSNGFPVGDGGRPLPQDGQFMPRDGGTLLNGQFEGRGEGRGRMEGGGGMMFGLIRNIGIIAVLVALIVIPKSIVRKKKRTPKPVLAE